MARVETGAQIHNASRIREKPPIEYRKHEARFSEEAFLPSSLRVSQARSLPTSVRTVRR